MLETLPVFAILPYLFFFFSREPMNSLMKGSCSAAGGTMVNQVIKSEETEKKKEETKSLF